MGIGVFRINVYWSNIYACIEFMMKLTEQIDQLSNCELTNIPFINLFLDTRESRNGKRSCDVFLERKHNFLHQEFLMNGGDANSFIKSWEMISDILCAEINHETQGLTVILHPDPEYEFAFVKQFNNPIDNKIIVDGIPQIGYFVELINYADVTS